MAAALSAIRDAATEVKTAASQMSGVGGLMVQSSDQLRLMLENTLAGHSTVSREEQVIEGRFPSLDRDVLPMGGAVAIYAATWGYEKRRAFNMGELTGSESWPTAAFEDGFLSALRAYGIIDALVVDGAKTYVQSLGIDPVVMRAKIRTFDYSISAPNFHLIIDRIDKFFGATRTYPGFRDTLIPKK